MATEVGIANRALQLLGAKSITSLTDDSTNARAVNLAYEPVKLSELRKHVWNFAVARASLAASSTAPLFTKTNSFPLPSDFLRLLPQDPEDLTNTLDWQIEGRNIVTNDSDPLEIRYIYDVTDPNEMDPLFREAFSAKLAESICEQLTQSNTKIANISAMYKDLILDAKRTNAIENVAAEAPEDTWITVRE